MSETNEREAARAGSATQEFRVFRRLLLAEIDRLCAAIDGVRALHEPISKDIPKCVTCKDHSGHHVDLPCPTLRALDGEP